MKASQLLAWFICLAIASFASVLAIHNSYKVALLERDFAHLSKTAGDYGALLPDVHSTLQSIEQHLRTGTTGGTDQLVDELRAEISALRGRIEALERNRGQR